MPYPYRQTAKRTYKPRYKAKPKARVSKPVKQYVKKAIEVAKEPNWSTQENNGSEMSFDTPVLTALFTPTQGDSVSTREGDRIEPVSIKGKYMIQMPSSTTVARVIFFQWKPDNNIDAPVLLDIIQDSAADAYTVVSSYIGSAVERKKFKILHDRIYNDPSGVANQVIIDELNITKFVNKYIYFNTGTTSAKGQVYMLLFSNINAAGTGPAFSCNFMLKWKDD